MAESFVSVICLVAVIASTGAKATTDEQRESIVEAACRAMSKAFETGDAEAISRYYTEDAKFVTKDSIIIGRDMIKEEFVNLLQTFDRYEWGYEYRDWSTTGDMTVEAGNGRLRLRGKDEWQTHRYVCSFVKETDDKWRLQYDSFM